MKERMDYYQKQAQTRLSTKSWLSAMQTKALDELNDFGFPTRHNEEWKYTLVGELLNQNFDLPKATTVAPSATDSPLKHRVTIYNGQIIGLESLTQQLPQGVLVLPLTMALKEHEALIKPYLGSILRTEHGFQALNTAMIHNGLFIYVPEGVHIAEPILLSHYQDTMSQAVYLRHVVVAKANSQLSLVEDYQGEGQSCYLTNTITEIALESGAKLNHYKIQRESTKAYHLGHLAVKQARQSLFESHSMSLGAKLARSDLVIDLNEEQARCLMNGIYLTGEGQHVDHHTVVNHKVPNCSSEQDYKGILSGLSQAVFNGKIVVSKDAQHTQAIQQNKNLLLSQQAQINTKPQLEIYANDVLCSHGATVGQLDEDALFYLATRGMDRLQASHFLIQAFAINNLRLLSDPVVSSWMEGLLMKQVEAL